jgi:hypothetical protein
MSDRRRQLELFISAPPPSPTAVISRPASVV